MKSNYYGKQKTKGTHINDTDNTTFQTTQIGNKTNRKAQIYGSICTTLNT